jgi:AcrR family transcriptional regulator
MSVREGRLRVPSRTRASILEVACEIIAERGENALRVTEIATRCNVSVATLYLHFGDREGLVCAALVERFSTHFRRDFPAVERVVESCSTPLEYFEQMTELSRVVFGPDRSALRLERAATIGMAAWRPTLRVALSEFYRAYNAEMGSLFERAQRRGLIRDDVDPSEVAQFTQMLYLGTAIRDLTEPSTDEIDRSLRVIDLALRAFLPPGTLRP